MLADLIALALGSALIVLGLLMAANRAGYVVLVVTPRAAAALVVVVALVGVALKLSIGR